MTTQEIITEYLNKVTEEIKKDAAAKRQKIPVSSFRVEATETEGRLYGADYFKYLVHGHGRPPGKQPPPEAMEAFVKANPQMLREAQQIWKHIREKGLAYIIGRKIARFGSDIFTGRKPGIDLVSAVENPREDFLKKVAFYQALNLVEKIKKAAPVAA